LRSVRSAEGDAKQEEGAGGPMSFMTVEQDLELSPEEYAMALESEIEAQRGKYYINGVVKPGNLVVPWKPVDEKALEKEARRVLNKNGIKDPAGDDSVREDGDLSLAPVGDQDVSVRWVAGEPGTKIGYVVERKAKNAMSFQELASYEAMETSYLLVKDYAGHVYDYQDFLVPPGSYTYRVLCRYRSGDVQVVDQKDFVLREPGGADGLLSFGFFVVLITALSLGSYFADQSPTA